MKPGQLDLKSRSTGSAYRVWGLTGGIASGKSLAARFFADEGIAVIDADRIAHELGAPGGMAHEALRQRFGTADRAQLRKIVFADSSARRDLEAIMHPLINAESMRMMRELAGKSKSGGQPVLIIYEAALLVETGRYKDLDGLLVVTAPEAIRIDRLVKRDGIGVDLAKQMIAAQLGDAERSRHADHILENASTAEDMKNSVTKLLDIIGR